MINPNIGFPSDPGMGAINQDIPGFRNSQCSFLQKNSIHPDKNRIRYNEEDSLDYTWRLGYKKDTENKIP
jgi:hypothetical protein